MGFFSNVAIDHHSFCHDHSYISPEMQLLWRLEELKSRLCELNSNAEITDSGECFCKRDLRYALPKQFKSETDLRKAIKLAASDLWELYGINVGAEYWENDPLDEICEMQLPFPETTLLLRQRLPRSAA